jgi:hypothetical protein
MLNYIYMKFMNKFLACINYLNKHFKECKHKSKSRSLMCRVCKVELRHKFLNAHNKNNRESSNQESGCVTHGSQTSKKTNHGAYVMELSDGIYE